MQPVSPHSETPDSHTVSQNRPTGRARQRHMARQARQQASRVPSRPAPTRSQGGLSLDDLSQFAARAVDTVRMVLQGFSWDFSPRQIVLIAAGLVGLVILFSLTSMLASGSVLPRVSVGGGCLIFNVR